MAEAACAVCGKVVYLGDQHDHLRSNHLGPHYFWMDGRKFRTLEPSMTGLELRDLTEAPLYPMFRDDGKGSYDFSVEDGCAVSLIGEPHFYCAPYATI
jgi:hypothetical protein